MIEHQVAAAKTRARAGLVVVLSLYLLFVTVCGLAAMLTGEWTLALADLAVGFVGLVLIARWSSQ